MQSLKDMDNVLDFRAEEALAALFQPDTVAPVEYLKIYAKKAWLRAGKKTYARGAGRCHRLLPKLCLCKGQPTEEMVFWKRRNGLTRRRASGYSPSRIFVTSYDLILSTLGKD